MSGAGRRGGEGAKTTTSTITNSGVLYRSTSAVMSLCNESVSTEGLNVSLRERSMCV